MRLWADRLVSDIRRGWLALPRGHSFQLWEHRVVGHLRVYVLQAALAVVALALVLYFVDVLTHAAIVAAVGSSAFVIFTVPHSPRAWPRRVVGGHLVGIAVGSAVALLVAPHFTDHRFFYLLGALSVGLSMLLMAATGTHHPPAAGTALGLVIQPWAAGAVAFVVASVFLLCLARFLLRPWIRNLIPG